MKTSFQKDEDLFHLFVLYTDQIPPEAVLFPYFQYMNQSIRTNFNQLKKKLSKKDKKMEAFDEFWEQLSNEDKVKVYCNWVLHLRKALQMQKKEGSKIQKQSIIIQDQIYIKKTSIFQKWEKKYAKLTPTHFQLITDNKTKDFSLKDYEIRKSKAKDNFAWVLQAINSSGKTIHCRASSQSMFNQWYYALEVNITNERITYFLNEIKAYRETNGGLQELKLVQRKSEKKKTQLPKENQKTLTQLMIDKQMKSIDNQNFTQIDEQHQNDQFQSFGSEEDQNDSGQKKSEKKKKKEQGIQQDYNPNIFRKLVPDYPSNSILSFSDTPFNSALILNENDYRIYQLPQRGEEGQSILKMFTLLPFQKSLVFQAISAQVMGWNDDVDVFTIKTKISSQNTALIYEKNKSYGLLYRQRDFLFLRHCFSIVNLKEKNTFIIDKSIDSIHHPPFMSVVRAEKKLIWGLIQKQNSGECILVVEGWIKGGGYMNNIQNKQTTIKYMKKINSIRGFLKQLSFSNATNNVFKEQWDVDLNQQETVAQNRKSSKSNFSDKQEEEEQQKVKAKKQIHQKQEKQLAQFMMRTEQQIEHKEQENKKPPISQQRFEAENYSPPSFTQDKFVIIPNQYLKKKHLMQPLQKAAKPRFFPHVRGHHLWKGEWEVLASGGLGYVDQEKMKQQKKVLTYIIKRIGKNIFSGKGILNVSLPVDIFCVESNIQRIAMSFGYFPFYLEKAAGIKEPHIQMKYLVGSGIASSLIYLTMEKPFNPILGQTYQCWIDGCPIYFEQISHHPPVASFLMKGRGYTVSGSVQAKMDLSINSGTGNNQGIFKVVFDNGNTFYYTTPAGCLSGLTYGERKLNFVGKCNYWSENGLFLELTYNPSAKSRGIFSGPKGEGDEKLSDYLEGVLKQFTPESIKQIAFKNFDNKLVPIIPKSYPTTEPTKTYQKISGRWNKYVKFGDQIIYDADINRYYSASDQKYPLPSHSNYRQDIVYRRLKNFVTSQQFKQILEVRQREDRKLRARFNKNSTH